MAARPVGAASLISRPSSSKYLIIVLIVVVLPVPCKTGGIAVLKGNLAPDTAVVKRSAVVPEMQVHEGPARVFDLSLIHI